MITKVCSRNLKKPVVTIYNGMIRIDDEENLPFWIEIHLDNLQPGVFQNEIFTEKSMKPTVEELKNRFSYHPPKGDQAARYERIRQQILETAILIVDMTPCCREQTIALNKLDEAMMLANASIARNE